MIHSRAGVIALSLTAAVVLGLLWASPSVRERTAPRLSLAPAELPADGYAIATLTIEAQERHERRERTQVDERE